MCGMVLLSYVNVTTNKIPRYHHKNNNSSYTYASSRIIMNACVSNYFEMLSDLLLANLAKEVALISYKNYELTFLLIIVFIKVFLWRADFAHYWKMCK